jgi:zinc protease
MEQKNLWLTKSASLSYQMTCTALSTFFSGTQYEKLFDADSAILKDTTYNSISLSYTQLLNASAYMIVFSGDVSFTEVFTPAENTFGMLMKQSERTQQEAHEPSVAKTTRKLRLRHTFTTDIAAENAGARPEVLVPTTDFSDPVQFWIQAPKILSF